MKHAVEFADRLGLSPAAITRRVRALSQAGEVKIRSDPRDSRSYTLELGRQRLDSFATELTARVAMALPDWDQSRVYQLTELLNELLAAANPQPPQRSVQHTTPWWRQT
ncbi:MAG: MarR family winged helix-turn-helix transcriptional regulator [Nocardioidaceae bacterium]